MRGADMAAQQRKVIAAGMIWNALEWYDFALYGYFAVAKLPHSSQVLDLTPAGPLYSPLFAG